MGEQQLRGTPARRPLGVAPERRLERRAAAAVERALRRIAARRLRQVALACAGEYLEPTATRLTERFSDWGPLSRTRAGHQEQNTWSFASFTPNQQESEAIAYFRQETQRGARPVLAEITYFTSYSKFFRTSCFLFSR